MSEIQPEQQGIEELQQEENEVNVEEKDDVAAIPTLSAEPSVNRLRPWKAGRTSSTAQTQKDRRLSKNWEKRMSERTQAEATKKLEREMKDEKASEAERRRTITKERKAALEEKRRLEEIAKKVSAKKLQRLKKRAGRSKKLGTA